MEQGSVTAGSAPASVERRAFHVGEHCCLLGRRGPAVEFTHLVDEPAERATLTSEQQLEAERGGLGQPELLNTRERARFCWRTSQVSSLSQICQAVLCISDFAGGSGPAFLSFPARTALPAQATAGFSLISVHQ